MKWISCMLQMDIVSVPAKEELDRIEEQLDVGHQLIRHIGNHTWEDEHRLACFAFLARYPEPKEE